MIQAALSLVGFVILRLNSRHVWSCQNLPEFQTQGNLGSGMWASKQQIGITARSGKYQHIHVYFLKSVYVIEFYGNEFLNMMLI